eukprot:1749642-Lingulodinium_polyedra.AAC.1
MQHSAVSTAGLILLLTHWQTVLPSPGRSRALLCLGSLLQCALPQQFQLGFSLNVPADQPNNVVPLSKAEATVHVDITDGMIHAEALTQHIPAFRRADMTSGA